MSRDDPSGSKRPEYALGSVDNALKMIWLLQEKGELRVSEAAAELGTSRSTAHRLLSMLQYHRFVEQDPATKAYGPGRGLIEIASSLMGGVEKLRSAARAPLERLSAMLEETVHLVILEGRSVLFVDGIESARMIRVTSRAGQMMPAHTTAAGKVILAELPEEELRRLYTEDRLEQLTPRSLSTVAELVVELDQVRRLGYATNFAESEPELAVVAVAISGLPLRRAAVGVSAPITRVGEDDVERIAAAATATVREIELASVAVTDRKSKRAPQV